MDRPHDRRSGGPPAGPPLSALSSYGLDLDRQLAIVELADGTRHELPLPRTLHTREAGLRRAIYRTAEAELEVTLPAGDEVILEMVDPGGRIRRMPGPVVYLDQLHWVTLAQCRWAPEKVAAGERAAAEELIALARRREITVALSSANMTETTQMDGRHRRHMATTLLAVSRGWQMRNPIAVRGREIRAALAGADPAVEGVFTLDPGAVFAEGPAAPAAPADFPPEWQRWFQTMTSVNAMVAAIIDDEGIKNADAKAMAAAWGRSHHELAKHMRENHTPKEHRRVAARGKLIGDLRQELAAAAAAEEIDGERLGRWLEGGLEDDLGRMPYLGRQHEVILERLSNADDHWEANDLADVNYLCCAAGYADFLVAEKKLCGYLNRVERRVPQGAIVCRKLAEVIEPLRAAVASGGSQDAGA
jgi:hypothetical protein